ncbi:MAG: thioesterase family protein [Anaerolineae bacterium]
MISVTQLQALPCFLRVTIPENYLDAMGHMNVRYYMGVFDDTTWKFFTRFGMTMEYYQTTDSGAFALAQHLRYLAEVHVGETVAVHSRLLGRSAKRIHFMHFMANETTGKLAATMEVLGSHADTIRRRTSPFSPQIASKLDALLAEHNRLDWEAPICGVLKP